MKLTENELKKLINEVLEEALTFGRRTKKASTDSSTKRSSPTTKGSKENPCPPESFGPGVGKKLFDPQNPSAISAGEWECNTQLEDDILITLQKFISRNKWLADDALTRKIFSNLRKTGEKTAVRILPKNTAIFRGASLNWAKRPQECLRIMNSLDYSNLGKEYYGYYRAPSSGYSYSPFRNSTSFTNDLESAYEFASDAVGIIYESNSSIVSDNSLIIEYNPSFYDLVDNPDYKIKQGGYHKGEKFNNVKRFETEKETLYIGQDPIPMNHIWIDPPEIIYALRKILNKFANASDAPSIYVNAYNNLLKIFKSKNVLTPRTSKYDLFGKGGFK